METFVDLLGTLTSLATLVAVVVAAVIGYRRFLATGGELVAKCDIDVAAEVVTVELEDGRRVDNLVVPVSVRNTGTATLILENDDVRVSVRCLDDPMLEAADDEAAGQIPWSAGPALVGLPFRNHDGEAEHDNIEGGGSISSAVAIPVPTALGRLHGFHVRFQVHARSAGGGEDYYWIADTVVMRDEPRGGGGHGNSEGDPRSRRAGQGRRAGAQAARAASGADRSHQRPERGTRPLRGRRPGDA